MLKFISETTDRLDKFIAANVDVSRVLVQKAIKDGQVLVNGIIVLDPSFNIKPEDKIELPEFLPEELKPSDIELNIIFENEDLAVIDKPAGMVVHPGAGNKEDTLANALLTRFPGIEKVGEPHRPGIVHRLDEDTSGLIVIAKTSDSYEYLKKTFQDRNIEKEYLALVHGQVPKQHDIIDLPLEKVPLKQKMKVGTGKEAQTEYWVMASGQIPGLDQMTLLRVKLHTGRTHQIRVHLAHIGNPIVGDQVYGNKQDLQLLPRQFLHAHRLKLQLPSGSWIELFSNLPKDLKDILNKANIIYDNDSNI